MVLSTRSGDCCILVAARDLFARDGFDAVSMSMIASEARVSKANLYHHYRSKENLYFAVLRDACDEQDGAWQWLTPGDGAVTDRLREFARQHLRETCDNPMKIRLIMREVAEHSDHRGRKLAEEIFGTGFSDIVALIKEGQRRGELDRAIDPALVASLLLSANLAFFQWRDVMRHMPDVPFADDPDSYVDGVVEVLLHGVSMRSASGARGRET